MDAEQMRDTLRIARVEAGFTQADAADNLDWSTSKVLRIEGGQTSVSASDARLLLDLYGVTDSALRNAVIEAARKDRAHRQASQVHRRRGKPTGTVHSRRGQTMSRAEIPPPEHGELLQAASEYTNTILLAMCTLNTFVQMNNREGIANAVDQLLKEVQQGGNALKRRCR